VLDFPGLAKGTELAIYDIRGRAVLNRTAAQAGDWRWDLTDQHGCGVPAGTYFAVIRFRDQTTRTKLCVVN